MRLPDCDRKAVIVLAAWALVALAWETGEVVQRNRGLYFDEWEVSVWRPGAPPQQRLEWFLRETEKRIPPGTRVAFTSVLDDRGDAEALSLYLWATHLLPGHTLRPVSAAGDPAVLDDVAYWATYNTTIEHPRARLLFRHPAGAVYRVVP
jgi:hypothetical protein